MLPRRQPEAPGADDARVLEIALAPSPVAGRKIDERGRALFVGAAEVGQHVDRVAGAKHEPGLDEIVAEDVSAERRSAGRSGSPQWSANARVRMMALWPQ